MIFKEFDFFRLRLFRWQPYRCLLRCLDKVVDGGDFTFFLLLILLQYRHDLCVRCWRFEFGWICRLFMTRLDLFFWILDNEWLMRFFEIRWTWFRADLARNIARFLHKFGDRCGRWIFSLVIKWVQIGFKTFSQKFWLVRIRQRFLVRCSIRLQLQHSFLLLARLFVLGSHVCLLHLVPGLVLLLLTGVTCIIQNLG